MTHSLLDWCTTYGTKLLSPFSGHLFSTNNIHVFEPIYTSILLIGVMLLLVGKRPPVRRQRILNWTVLFSTLYLAWTFISKGIANYQFVNELEAQHIAYERFIVSPTPFNSVLWHGIAKTSEGYYLATYSLFDQRASIPFYFEFSANDLIEKIDSNRLVKYYLEYTQDFPLIKLDSAGTVQIYAIKYGAVNYFGQPRFIYPLVFNIHDMQDENIKIDHSSTQKGPVENYHNLWVRIKGI